MAKSAFKSSSLPTHLFSRPRSRSVFDGNALANHLCGVVARYIHDPDALFFETRNPRCRVAVLATISAHADAPPYIFQTDSPAPAFKAVDVS
jgi:hypothetical protein